MFFRPCTILSNAGNKDIAIKFNDKMIYGVNGLN